MSGVKRCAVLIALAFVGCSSEPVAPAKHARAQVRPAVFESLPDGWHQFDEGVQRIGPCRVIAYTLAASWGADRAGRHGWAAEMPRDAIAVTVGLVGPPHLDRLRTYYAPVGDVPLRLPTKTGGTLEGYPRVPEYRAFRRAPDYLVEVRAAINSPHPGRALLRRAASAVERIRLPDWPKLCRGAA
jgi:hypothetical protein